MKLPEGIGGRRDGGLKMGWTKPLRGREAARKRGVRFGRPRKLSLDQEQLARRLVLEGKSASDIARTFNVHAATIYRLAQMR
jgi:DNA invertase Pin-like site-specific DNA recombinase